MGGWEVKGGGGALIINFDGYFLMLIIKRGMGLTSVQEEEGLSLSQKNELCLLINYDSWYCLLDDCF